MILFLALTAALATMLTVFGIWIMLSVATRRGLPYQIRQSLGDRS